VAAVKLKKHPRKRAVGTGLLRQWKVATMKDSREDDRDEVEWVLCVGIIPLSSPPSHVTSHMTMTHATQ